LVAVDPSADECLGDGEACGCGGDGDPFVAAELFHGSIPSASASASISGCTTSGAAWPTS
jgi:hypothetical protein